MLTYFAARLGTAESATWILTHYIWGLITVVPDCISSAAEMRISNLLSKEKIAIAKKMSFIAMIMCGISAILSNLVLYFSRYFITCAMTNDDILTAMLLDIIPYYVLCQPFVSVITAACYLNRALGMYGISTKVELLATCLATIPAAYISTIYFNYNIEGLTSAAFIGYATLGFFTIALLMNADWGKAKEVNKKMSGVD